MRIARGRRRLALVTAAVLAAACQRQSQRRPDIILVTIDTVRADRVGAYGATAGLTPALDAVARQGLVYESASAPLPETRPAHFALMTARYPVELGVLSNVTPLGSAAVTLAEALARAGYETDGVVACTLLDRRSGAQRGFTTLHDGNGALTRDGAAVVDDALTLLRHRDPRRPLFLWVHLFDAHIPYEAHDGWQARPAAGAPQVVTWPWLEQTATEHGGDLPASALERAEALYAGEVAYADAQLARLFAALGRQAQPALLAVVADHGECFEHGTYCDHSGCPYQGAIHVPLLLRWPGRLPAGKRIAAAVSTAQLAPTLLQLADVDAPGSFALPPLPLAAAGGGTAYFMLPLYPAAEIANRNRLRSHLRSVAGHPTRPPSAGAPQVGVRAGDWVYLRLASGEELYDLRQDPAQEHDLARERPHELRQMRRDAVTWLRAHPMPRPRAGDMAPETIDRLRALSYL